MLRTNLLWPLKLALIAASLVGFLQWGNQQKSFVALILWDILRNPQKLGAGVFHPMIGLPLLGLAGLMVSVFWKSSPNWLTYFSIGAILPLYLMIFLAGILALHPLIILSALPFLGISVLLFQRTRMQQHPTV